MKKYTIYLLSLVLICGFLFFYAGSCNKGYEYYIKFKANGEEVILGLGAEGIEENAFATVIRDERVVTLFVASSESSGSSGSTIRIELDGDTAGEYSSEYGRITIYYVDSGTSYSLLDGSVTVTSFGEVGGAIVGTFEATLYEYDAGANSLKGTKAAPPVAVTITDGSFKVKRIADNAIDPI